jgi:hypothetical protein
MTTYFHLLPRLRISEATIPPPPLHISSCAVSSFLSQTAAAVTGAVSHATDRFLDFFLTVVELRNAFFWDVTLRECVTTCLCSETRQCPLFRRAILTTGILRRHIDYSSKQELHQIHTHIICFFVKSSFMLPSSVILLLGSGHFFVGFRLELCYYTLFISPDLFA